MNYLGHLFFSNNDIELMYANMYGDFLKGSHLDEWPTIVQRGSHLHRKIDSFIDHHPQVLELKHLLSHALPKIAGIAIDLYFDHILAKNWEKFHPIALRDFVDAFHSHHYDKSIYPNPNFHFVIKKMKTDDWLYNYQFFSGLTFACQGLSKRISFSNQLWNAPDVFNRYQPEIEDVFSQFMSDAIPHFNNYFTSKVELT